MNDLLQSIQMFNRAIDEAQPNVRVVKVIPVVEEQSEENWEYVSIKDKKGYHIAVF